MTRYTECVSYVRGHLDDFRAFVKEEEGALKEAEERLKQIRNPLIETLFHHIAVNEENHINMLKALVKEARG